MDQIHPWIGLDWIGSKLWTSDWIRLGQHNGPMSNHDLVSKVRRGVRSYEKDLQT